MMPPQMPQGGMPQDGPPMCPMCGREMPAPFNSGGAPNMPLPPGALEQPQQENSALLAALMGGGGQPY